MSLDVSTTNGNNIMLNSWDGTNGDDTETQEPPQEPSPSPPPQQQQQDEEQRTTTSTHTPTDCDDKEKVQLLPVLVKTETFAQSQSQSTTPGDTTDNKSRISDGTSRRHRRRRSGGMRRFVVGSNTTNSSSHSRERRRRQQQQHQLHQQQHQLHQQQLHQLQNSSSPILFSPSAKRRSNCSSHNGNISMVNSSCDYTEHTYHSTSVDGDNDDKNIVVEYSEFDESEFHEEVIEETEEYSSADALSSSEGGWNSDDGIAYTNDAPILVNTTTTTATTTDHRFTNRPLQNSSNRQPSSMTLSAHTLSTAFSLDDLGSAATVSSLGDDDDDDDDDDTDDNHFGLSARQTLFTVDGVGILNIGASTPTTTATTTKIRGNGIITNKKNTDTIDELCSLNSTDRKLRHLEQKIATHEMCNNMGNRTKNRTAGRTANTTTADSNNPSESSMTEGNFHEDDEDDDQDVTEESVEEEEEEEESLVENDQHEAEVLRVVSRMHQSMVITNAPPGKGTTNPHMMMMLSSTKRGLADPVLPKDDDDDDDDDDNTKHFFSRKYSLDDLDGSANDETDFPNDLSAAREYLSRLAAGHFRNHTHDDGSANHYYSSDDYTEVLVSSNDSFEYDDDEEVILDEIVVSSPLKH
ncbi:hypothetical protein IV203_027358 [Nitzschia inconspicua]|uniref:Uncharacterized protein n=1 Tax=Nitzschia inconspicua TaxID=303405 RepID=A0A9K3Q399_9STRA|nr:hypothetical protein IV203_027358 [Nitzschia inconspicua]